LLPVVAALALREAGGLAALVLRHLVDGVLLALLALAVRLALLGDVHHLRGEGGERGAAAAEEEAEAMEEEESKAGWRRWRRERGATRRAERKGVSTPSATSRRNRKRSARVF